MKRHLIALFVLLSSPAFAQQGTWEPAFPFGDLFNPTILPIAPIHLIHVFDGVQGKVIAITFGECPSPTNPNPEPCEPACDPCPAGPGICSGKVYLWTPSQLPGNPGLFHNIPNCRNYQFCCGHCALADGRILTVGGSLDDPFQPYADLFDPNPLSNPFLVWSIPGNMAQPRWYPTATTLWDGKVLVTSGNDTGQHGEVVQIPEIYNPVTNAFTQVPNAAVPWDEALYPWMFLLPDGNLVKAGHGNGRILGVPDPNNPSTWGWGNSWMQNPLWPPNHEPPAADAEQWSERGRRWRRFRKS